MYLLVLSAMAVDFLALALVQSIQWLVVAHAAASLCGNVYSALPIGFAMIADDGGPAHTTRAGGSHSRELDFTAAEAGMGTF